MHPYRSVLYLPGSRERVLEKAKDIPADALIFDLEDAVAPDEKDGARKLVAQMVRAGGYGSRKILIRVNGADTIWGMDDVKMALEVEPDGILLPKVNSAQMIHDVARHIKSDKTKVWAMMETALGVINAPQIAATEVEGFVLGTNDLAKELRSRTRAALIPAVAQVLLAARAYDVVCVDGVFNAFKDDEGLKSEAREGLELGMDGKSLIHPMQVEISNEIFSPNVEDIALAHRQVEAYEAAIAKGEAVAVVDGKIVENLHVENAQRLIALDLAIKALAQ